MKRGRLAVALAALAASLAAPAALADQSIEAGPGSKYLTKHVTMDQGERLTFHNLDATSHDVTADDSGPGGGPLFRTPVIAGGSDAFVDGSQYLTAGDYRFHCSIHPYMQGTLTVTSAGKPVPRPNRSDTRAPGIAVKIVSKDLGSVVTSGRLRVSFRTDEKATVKLGGTVRHGGRAYTLGKASRHVPAGRRTTVRLGLSKRAEDALAGAKSARFTVRATTRDAAGNRGYGGASRTLRR